MRNKLLKNYLSKSNVFITPYTMIKTILTSFDKR